MHVGLNTSSTSTASALRRAGVSAPQASERSADVQSTPSRSAFPEAGLLSRRPLRYNVQLNHQLTAVQRADDYLAQTETRLLLLRQAAGANEMQRQASALQMHIEQRGALSGGTIDRQLTAALQKQSGVRFTLPGIEPLLANPGGETLLFALGGRERQLAAVALPQEGTARQILTQLNTGLGRLGIHGALDGQGQLVFSAAEAGWDRISQQLSVRGEGHNYPADAFTLLAPQAEASSSEGLVEQLRRREPIGPAAVRKTLDHLTAQRSQLRQQQDRVAARIADMAASLTPQQAQESAAALGQSLGNSAGHYLRLSTALGAQANVHPATVKNLLG
ncbi:hypothetical protein ACRS85_17415 [Pluralibacter gergoviae]|uniref:hypothetical protein n=1 Tax=Pluralibacter gergoviae TaxID=61647 RepID=UPI003EE0B058